MSREAERQLGVLIVHPISTARAGLALLIDSEPGMETLVEVATCEDALRTLRRLRRRSALVFLVALNAESVSDPFLAIRSIRDEFPSTPVLTCGRAVDELLVSRALFFGADGFVDYACPPHDFLGAIRRIAAGEFVLEGVSLDGVGVVARGIDQQQAVEHLLTQREMQVLNVASEGLTARQIGRRLGVEERTVTTHLGHIYRKLGASGRVAALAAASRFGLVGTAKS